MADTANVCESMRFRKWEGTLALKSDTRPVKYLFCHYSTIIVGMRAADIPRRVQLAAIHDWDVKKKNISALC